MEEAPVLPSSEITSLVSLQSHEELISETTARHHTFRFFCLLCPVSVTGSLKVVLCAQASLESVTLPRSQTLSVSPQNMSLFTSTAAISLE